MNESITDQRMRLAENDVVLAEQELRVASRQLMVPRVPPLRHRFVVMALGVAALTFGIIASSPALLGRWAILVGIIGFVILALSTFMGGEPASRFEAKPLRVLDARLRLSQSADALKLLRDEEVGR